jgi:hypothetical protein
MFTTSHRAYGTYSRGAIEDGNSQSKRIGDLGNSCADRHAGGRRGAARASAGLEKRRMNQSCSIDDD